MVMKHMSRRDFLKLLAAGATAAGLSHFQFLNFGGVDPALADACDGIAIPDYCNPGEDPDLCPDHNAASSDVCIPEREEFDECMPDENEADVCDLTDSDPDICDEAGGDPDVCEVPPGLPDTCKKTPDDVDVCPDGFSGDGDICNETGPQADPDECIPAVGESDGCTKSAEPDFCRNPDSGQVEHDLCNPPGDPDICAGGAPDACLPPNDPDDPNALSLGHVQGRSSLVTTLGSAAAVLALGAALSGKKKS